MSPSAPLDCYKSAAIIEANQDKPVHWQLVIDDISYVELPIAVGYAVKAVTAAPKQGVHLGRETFKRTCFGKGRTCADRLLLRCLLRESGQDIKDGLERPIGTRWVHYALPRVIYDVPRPKPRPRSS